VQQAIAAELQRDVPLRTLQAFLASLKKNNRALVKALTDPDRARSHHKPAFGSRSMNVTRPTSCGRSTPSPADAMCATAEGPRRYALTAVIDVLTRRARVVVSDQPRGLATQALLRRAIADFGMPEVLKADNGKEYRNRAVERFCRDTGIRLEFSRPFSPEEKGHIERFFKTLSHGFLSCCPATSATISPAARPSRTAAPSRTASAKRRSSSSRPICRRPPCRRASTRG
jgi:putative transposase